MPLRRCFGKGDTYVLLVPRGDTATETALSEALKELPEVTSIVSWVDLAGAQIPYEYLDEDTLSQLESEHYSRMVLSLDVDYEGEETFSLVETIRSIAQQYYPDTYYLAGEGVSTYDLMNTVTADMQKVNFVAIGAVFVVLLLTLKSISLPVILVLTIETSIWINLSFPYYMDSPLFYIAYLIISSIQLGATVDYAILFTDRYRENRQELDKGESVVATISNVTTSVLTSGTVLTVVGFLLGIISTHGLLSQLGYLLGRGTNLFDGSSILRTAGTFVHNRRIVYQEKRKTCLNEWRMGNMNKRKVIVRTASVLLAGTMVLDGGAQTILAAAPSEKEEVVYAILDASGEVTGVYVVNSFAGGTLWTTEIIPMSAT